MSEETILVPLETDLDERASTTPQPLWRLKVARPAGGAGLNSVGHPSRSLRDRLTDCHKRRPVVSLPCRLLLPSAGW
jgi:hypothetical protein